MADYSGLGNNKKLSRKIFFISLRKKFTFLSLWLVCERLESSHLIFFLSLFFSALVLGWNEKRRIHKQMINDVASREMNTQNEARVERKKNSKRKKSIIQQQLNELWFQTRARPRLSSKYCSLADAIAQNGRLFFSSSSFAFVVLIFYLFGILCSFLIIIVNGKNVLSWCVSFGTFLSFLPSIWHLSLCRCFHSTKCIQFRAHSYYTFRCAYTRSCLFFLRSVHL